MTHPLWIEKPQRGYAVEFFACSREALNRFLIRYVFQNQQAGASAGQVEYDDVPERLTKGLVPHPVPIRLPARLAVAASWQGKGPGAGLLKDAMVCTVHAADIAGIRAFAAHAKDGEAKGFYERCDFVSSPSDPLSSVPPDERRSE